VGRRAHQRNYSDGLLQEVGGPLTLVAAMQIPTTGGLARTPSGNDSSGLVSISALIGSDDAASVR